MPINISKDSQSLQDSITVESLQIAKIDALCDTFLEKMKRSAVEGRAGFCGTINLSAYYRLLMRLEEANVASQEEGYSIIPVLVDSEDTNEQSGVLVLFPWRDRNVTFKRNTPGNIKIPPTCTKILEYSGTLVYVSKEDRIESVDNYKFRTALTQMSDINEFAESLRNNQNKMVYATVYGKDVVEALVQKLQFRGIEFDVNLVLGSPASGANISVYWVDIDLVKSLNLNAKIQDSNDFFPKTPEKVNKEVTKFFNQMESVKEKIETPENTGKTYPSCLVYGDQAFLEITEKLGEMGYAFRVDVARPAKEREDLANAIYATGKIRDIKPIIGKRFD